MNKILVTACFILASLVSFAQRYTEKQAVFTSQTGGRYEIVQSDIRRSLTFRLDKYTGEVYRLVVKQNDEFCWEYVKIYDQDKVDRDHYDNTEITYQLYLGGIAVADCFLLNIKTGDTWQLIHDNEMNIDYFLLMKKDL